MKLVNVIKLVLFILLITLGIFLFYYSGGDLTEQGIKTFISDTGGLAAAVFIAIFVVGIILALPVTVFYIVAGLLFGPVNGSIYIYLGSILGSVIVFLLGRFFGEGIREYLDHTHFLSVRKINKKLNSRGALLVMLLRFVPFLPYSALSYFFALTKVKFKDYFLGTITGVIPGIIIIVYFGSNLMNFSTPIFWGLIIFIGVILFVSWVFRKKLINKLHKAI